MTTTVTPQFLAVSPLRTARRHAEADLRDVILPASLTWLHDRPLLWLRALQRLERDAQTRTAKDRARVAHLKPVDGGQATAEYLLAKRELQARTAARLHWMAKVVERIEDVKALIGPQPAVGYLSVGDVVAALTEVAEMADEGDLAAAADTALFWAKRWAEQAKREAA